MAGTELFTYVKVDEVLQIPSVNLSAAERALANGDDCTALRDALQASLYRNGVMLISDIGEEFDKAERELRTDASKLFNSPKDAKEAGSEPDSGKPWQYRGERQEVSGMYSQVLDEEKEQQGLGGSDLSQDPLQKDQKESFQMGPDVAPADDLPPHYGKPTAWPTGFDGFRTAAQSYYAASVSAGQRFWAVIEGVFGANKGEFTETIWDDTQITSLKINFYKSSLRGHEHPASGVDVKVAEHVDATVNTVLCLDPADASGDQVLQVWDPADSKWKDVPSSPQGHVIFQLGLLSQPLCNRKWRVSWHRVVSRPGTASSSERISFVTFMVPHPSKSLHPRSPFIDNVDPAAGPSVQDMFNSERLKRAAELFSGSQQ